MTQHSGPTFVEAGRFDDWRLAARRLLNDQIEPHQTHWIDLRQTDRESQTQLFDVGPAADAVSTESTAKNAYRVPPEFIELSRLVAANRSSERWQLLYRMLWRLTHGQHHLLEIASDPDCVLAREMAQAVHRDAHKMKAFVRFRKRRDALGDLYVAWHRPLHYVVDLTADFFARRFDVMRWMILTPDDSVGWDGKRLAFGPGVSRFQSELPDSIPDQEVLTGDDPFEGLWKTYYAHIFNPARIKLKAMQAQMPKHHWKTMPETELIDEMLRAAPSRVEEMVRNQEGFEGASAFVPDTRLLPELATAASHCQGCDLYRHATQTVFGAGPSNAKWMLIGEQPGDQEDLEGVPFIGPAGRLLRSVLKDVGLDIDTAYVTNTVKHFKFKQTATRRLHVKPSSREIGACNAWLDAEIKAIQPRFLVCLGATAASAVFGPTFRITKQRGVVLTSKYGPWTLATYHPSALLRVPDMSQRETMTQQFHSDLRLVAQALGPSENR